MGRIPGDEPSKSVQKYSLGYIRPYHREIMRRLVLGQKQADICRELGMSEGRMSIITQSPIFKIELKKMEEARDKGVLDVTTQLKELSPIALEAVERTLYNAKSDSIRLKAAESILDRAGYGVVRKGELNVRHSTETAPMSDDELRKLVIERATRMREAANVQSKLEEEAKDIPEVEWEKTEESEECSSGEHKVNIVNLG